MSTVWMCTDWHLTHRNMAMKYRPGFDTIKDHDEYFINAWVNNVTKRDKVICLGDMATSLEGIKMIDSLPAEQKHLVLGNHDLDNDCNLLDQLNAYDKVTGPVRYKEFWLSHFPIHTSELRGKVNLHGHIHGSLIDDPRYVNLCPEAMYHVVGRPIIKFQELRELIRTNQYLEDIKQAKGWYDE